MSKIRKTVAGFLLALFPAVSLAQTAPRDVPARSIPVPTDVSPQMAAIIGAPLRAEWNVLPKSGEEWRARADAGAVATAKIVDGMAERLHVKIESGVTDGVKVFTLTPDVIPPENQNRLLVHVHGGCYLLNPGKAGLVDAVLLAGFGHFKVLAADYRMPPDAYFPAALDDAMTVYKAAIKMTNPKNIGVFGMSAGGALTLEMMLRAKLEGLPMPAAIAPGTPMADATKVGDSFQTNELVDNVLVSRDGFCDAATVFYAHGHDLKDPLISPIYGDMHGFPPAILTTGTRDLLLSNTVRTHRKLREAGVEASLQVYDGQAHAEFARDDTAPENAEAFHEIAAFFDAHLGK
ncbi:alpha/beta hydrolase fold domain-containing protein [Acidisphaera sp. L21]|jgi:monoterpene epsilon-lactone hydrolase|uniref:alpha/beta hydrolase fold domain-containing protein n=1 Tax=Acidisphaera sp. L21 TaxID=1641851 RepID=UPI00131CD8FF|nr:alpha/beta hydrolase [Acidisphaera sp. L21]